MRSSMNPLSSTLLLGLLQVLLLSSLSSAIVIRNPTYRNLPLDYCREFETDCGKPAADYYCKSMGYTMASNENGPVAVDSGRTIVASSGAICDTNYHSCDTFSLIECFSRFDAPDWTVDKRGNQLPLDWCLNFGSSCGKPAAQYFCQQKGFERASDYGGPVEIMGGKTVVAKTGAVCDTTRGRPCSTFEWISCV